MKNIHYVQQYSRHKVSLLLMLWENSVRKK